MKVRIEKNTNGFRPGTVWDVMAVIVHSHADPLFVFMVKSSFGLFALRYPNITVVDGDLSCYDFVVQRCLTDGGLMLHKVFGREVSFYESVLEFDRVAIERLNHAFETTMPD